MDGQAYQDRIRSQLSGMLSTGSTEGTVTGGSFAFNEDDMVKIRDNWLDLAESYRKSLRNADRMSRIDAPAEDMASKFHANAANRSGESYMAYLKHNRSYCEQQAQMIHDTLADYLGIERANIIEIDTAGDQGPVDGV